MKQRFLLKTMLLLCALIVGSSSVWAEDELYYTLDGTTTATGNAYATATNLTQNEISWAVVANTEMNPWRVGGKSIENQDREIKSTDAMGAAITQVKVEVGSTGGSLTVNSIKLIVASDADFNSILDEITKTSNLISTTLTFTPSSGTEWATGAYYKIVFNVTRTSSSGNGYVEFKNAKFYKAASTDPSSEVAFANETPSINFPATTTYTQAATTAAGYDGTVTYEITANTAGATLEGTTLTVTQEGSVTVKATAPAITGWTKTEATYTLTVNDTRSPNGLAYATATQNVYVGDVLDAPTLTNPNSLPVTYSSLDETVATVDASGNVTGVKIGSTTIKATFDGNESYKAGSVSYTINVTKAPFAIEDGVFDFVEAGSSDPVVDYGSGVTQTNSSSTYVTEDKTWTAGNVTMVTSVESGNGYRWWSNDHTLRFYAGSKATFSVPEGYVITKIVTTGTSFDGASTGELSGTTWTGVANSVALSATGSRNIKKIKVAYEEPVSVTLNSYGYATFCSEYPLDFSDDSEFSAWQISAANSSTGVITFSQITGTVEEGTGVLLKGEPSTTINIPLVDSGSFDVGSNKLVGITTATPVSDNQYYGLSGKKFVKVNAGTVPAGKALLPASEVGSAPSLTFVFEDGETTGIQNVNVNHNDNQWYDLSGRRIENPSKGVYIMNGKKVVIK